MRRNESSKMERRRFKRLPVSLPVTLRYRGRLIPATALNISCGGMCLSTESSEIVGDDAIEVILDLSLAELDVSVRGKIIRIDAGINKKVGVQFTSLYSIGHQAIEKYIQRKDKN